MRFAIATSVVSPAPQPGIAVAGAELDAGAHDLARLDAGVEQPEHRLRDDERDVLLEPVAQAALQVLDDAGLRPRDRRTTSPSRTSTSKPRASSAHRSSVQPETRSKRAWCQWQVTSPASTVPWWSGKPRCGQRSSIAYAASSCQNTTTGSEPTFVRSWPVVLQLGQCAGSGSPRPCAPLSVFTQIDTCDNLPVDERRQVRHPRARRHQAPDRRPPQACRVDARRARGCARADRGRGSPAPRCSRGQRTRHRDDAPADRAGPTGTRVGAHRPRPRPLPRSPRRSHGRPARRDAPRARRRRARRGDRRARRSTNSRRIGRRSPSAGRCARVSKRSRECAPTRAISPRSSRTTTATSCSSSTTVRSASQRAACQNLCRSELEVFRAALGDDVEVRTDATSPRREPALRVPVTPVT